MIRHGTARFSVAIALGVLGAVLSACSSDAPIPSASSDVLPPAQAVADANGSWATILMGHLDDPLNTFGELLYRPGGPTCPGAAPCAPADWALATPPGVASNGGLFAAVDSSGTVTAGFGVTLDLRFSPLAQSSDAGATWSPGILPAGLVPVTDALAASGPDRLALASAGGGQVLTASGDLSTWSVLAKGTAIDAGARRAGCTPGALTAVAVTATGDDLAAAVCTSGRRAGVFRVGSGGRAGVMTPLGPTLPGSVTGPIRVDRLVSTSTGLSALVEAGSGSSTRLFLATSTDGALTWSVSSPFATEGTTVSASVDDSGTMVVVVARGNRLTAAVGAPGAPWVTLPAPPRGTSVVVSGPTGSYSALIPSGSTLTVDVLSGGRWAHHQTMAVPIQYGSTSAGGGASG